MKRNILLVAAASLFAFASCCKAPKEDNSNLTLLTKKSEYSIPFSSNMDEYPSQAGFDYTAFSKKILDKVMAGEIKPYSHFGEEITLEEVRINFGAVNDTVSIENPDTGELEVKVIEGTITPEKMNEILFEEEWYLNEENMQIEKKVTRIGFARHFYRTDDIALEDLRKVVVFMVNYEDVK